MDKLQWGNRKRLRCVKMKASTTSPSVGKSDVDVVDGFGVKKKKITPRLDRRLGLVTTTAASAAADNQESHPHPLQSPNRLITTRELGMNNRSRSGNEGGKMLLTSSSSPEKEEYYRYYTTRGSMGGLDESSSKILMEQQPLHLQEDYNNNRISNYSSSSSAKVVWPRLFIALSSKEKEEDFMAMKGCKPPQRPKKRAKLIQKSLLFVSPGAWLSDLCQERYEVREKKTSKKRPRGLKAMGSIESDSE